MGEILKWSYIPKGLGDRRFWQVTIDIMINRDTIISHGVETMYPLGWSQGFHDHVVYMAIAISSMKFEIYPLWTRVCQIVMV